MKRWGIALVVVTTAIMVVIVLLSRRQRENLAADQSRPQAATVARGEKRSLTAPSDGGWRPLPRFVPAVPSNPIAADNLRSSEAGRELEMRKAAAMDRIGARLGLTPEQAGRLKEWTVTGAELRFRIKTDPPVTSKDELWERREKAWRASAAQKKAELQLLGGDEVKWNQYRAMGNRAADGKLDLVDNDGEFLPRRPPRPDDEVGVVTRRVTPLWQKDTTAYDRHFE